ncbi:V-type ATP synthase subunit I [Thiocapsa imhoffii]|uniref:V-type ATP synthase subunit I n=1 Tax=Thiocapsa imhoffii TaxID=382777 RepID=A0A9X0WIR4_9GAMM|nr:V-type ATPase 116kDa subunit family protein [Thiocapsa imhoffii]MBK1645496.1 V-type ATP synthase subunit I [Thiocapsa imhoffii]
MSIERLQRITLAGLVGEKGEMLARLQALGCLHLIPLRPAAREPEKEPPAHAVEAMQALRYLQGAKEKRRQVRDVTDFDLPRVIRAVLDNQQRRRDVTDERDALRERVHELESWGDFRLPSAHQLAGQKLWFYLIPQRQMVALAELDLPWQVVHRDHRQAWVVVIHPDEPPRDALPVRRAHVGSLALSEVRRRLEAAELALEDVHSEHQSLTRWIYQLTAHLAQAEDQAQLRYAEAQTQDDEHLFLIQGWAPVKSVPAVTRLAADQDLALLVEEPGPEDAPPTLLETAAPIAAGKDLVAFYQMPSYQGWDPSGVLFFSFTAFFAMILSDAGYAALLGIVLLAYWRRLGRDDLGRRLRLLGASLVSASIVWGVVVGGYFGVSPPPDSLLGHLHLLNINDLEVMMRLSVGVGVFHIVLANVQMMRVQGWRRAQGRVAAGWVLAVLGAFGYWLAHTPEVASWMPLTAQGMMILGFALIFLLGSERPITGVTSILLRVLDGLKNLLRVTQAFGDVLSYLRLFALGLASASLAITFNGLARDAAAELAGVGILFAILILLVGHTLNILLTIVSGVVHGLRLNFIEFYNWALSGEGYAFRPFKRKELRE